ncbi:MAG: hypothetical protein MJ197_09475 [Bacteroidales bacterium]|nr:hypothetical protein [Bacteroidales bacterium]
MKKLFLVITCTALFYACTEYCEQFPKEYKDYTPYEKDDVLCFENTTGEYFTFEVTKMDADEGQKKIPWGCKCVCGSYLSYEIHSQKNNSTIKISSYYGNNNYWDVFCQIIDSTNRKVDYVEFEKKSDTLLLYPSKDSKRKETIKFVKGVGLVNLFIADEEYTLKKE